eukprot:TRINITY_DN710_c0_g1_i1.p1 TRINITY_DN710_c0_g1~~TRINITY_DN710_c0_g1_i1.p1  ORF type:complete len:165 (+),score=21.28 TRINITY_DN710_c0_g1_i1:95-589(+)
MSILEKIHALRDFNGNKRQTVGLSDDEITALAAQDERIAQVVDAAVAAQKVLIDAGVEDLLKLDEKEQMTGAQEGIVNFYPQDSVQPYVALAGLGPWVVSTCGAVLFDTGGFGLLCFSPNPHPPLFPPSRGQGQGHECNPPPQKPGQKGGGVGERGGIGGWPIF